MDDLDFVIADIEDIVVDKEFGLKTPNIEMIEEIERKVVGWLDQELFFKKVDIDRRFHGAEPKAFDVIIMTVRQKESGYLSVMVFPNVFLYEIVRVGTWINNNAWLAVFTDDIHVADIIVPDVESLNFHKKNKAIALFICIPYGVSFYCSVCKTSFFPSC